MESRVYYLCITAVTLLQLVESRSVTNYAEAQLLGTLKQSQNKSWDHFVYTQQWPPSMCAYGEKRCVIPKNVTSWTVHGLWPSEGKTLGPFNCNASWQFDPKQIQPLLGELMAHWPNLYTTAPSDLDDFWKHEWMKHGTCSTNKPQLNTEYKYFKMGLDLQRSVDIASVLKKNNMVPNNSTSYPVEKVRRALESAFANDSIVMECEYGKEPQQQYLYQIEVCLDKDTFQPMTCPLTSRSRVTSQAFGNYKQQRVAHAYDEKPQGANYRYLPEDLVGKCAGDPYLCECIDTVVIPQYFHPMV